MHYNIIIRTFNVAKFSPSDYIQLRVKILWNIFHVLQCLLKFVLKVFYQCSEISHGDNRTKLNHIGSIKYANYMDQKLANDWSI